LLRHRIFTSPTKSALVHVVSHSGLETTMLVVRHPDHTRLSQSLLHRITWREADSAAQHELDEHLKGGADKLGNVHMIFLTRHIIYCTSLNDI